MSENNFQYVCGTDQVPEVQSRAFSIAAGRGSKIEIAFFNLDGAFYVVSNVCIHKGKLLSFRSQLGFVFCKILFLG